MLLVSSRLWLCFSAVLLLCTLVCSRNIQVDFPPGAKEESNLIPWCHEIQMKRRHISGSSPKKEGKTALLETLANASLLFIGLFLLIPELVCIYKSMEFTTWFEQCGLLNLRLKRLEWDQGDLPKERRGWCWWENWGLGIEETANKCLLQVYA